jgi:VanZ family protein
MNADRPIITFMKPIPFALVTIILTVILSIPVPPHQSQFVLDFLNAGHAPLFGVAALILLRFALRERKGALREYLSILLIASLLGVFTELVQRMEGGDAELRDVLVDFLGASCFLMIHWTMHHRASAYFRWSMRIAVLAIFAGIFWPPYLSGMSLLHRNRSFPVLMNFDSTWDLDWCRSDDADFQIAPAPAGARRPPGDRMGRITFRPTKSSYFLLSDVYPDWAGYRLLEFSAYSENSGPQSLTIRLRDRRRRSSEMVANINPGAAEVRIPLSDLRQGSAPGPLDTSSIYQIILSPTNPTGAFSLYLDDFHLE